MKPFGYRLGKAALVAALLSSVVLPATASAEVHRNQFRVRHVLLISIDGFHQVDLQTCIAAHTCPHLAGLAEHGTSYTQASTSKSRPNWPRLSERAIGMLRILEHGCDTRLFPSRKTTRSECLPEMAVAHLAVGALRFDDPFAQSLMHRDIV